MDRDELRRQIESAFVCGRGDERRLVSLLADECWPGGPEDRTEPIARDWVRRWRPKPAAVELRPCSCATGPCVICN